MILSTEMPRLVYHYCSVKTFFDIIENSTLRMTNISKSNDSEEITYIKPKMISKCEKELDEIYHKYLLKAPLLPRNAVNDAFEGIFNEFSLYFYVACFSQNPDLLSQWRGYADNGKGVAIGFRSEMLVPLAERNHNFIFNKVRYNIEDLSNEIKNYFENVVDEHWDFKTQSNNILLLENLINSTVSKILYDSVLYKNPAFYEEDEWRLIYNPFGKIRRITNIKDFFCRMQESFIKKERDGGFSQGPIEYKVSNDKIISFIDLSFESIKDRFIYEIICGPKCEIDDSDLRLFLMSKGYNVHYSSSRMDNVEIIRSKSSYR